MITKLREWRGGYRHIETTEERKFRNAKAFWKDAKENNILNDDAFIEAYGYTAQELLHKYIGYNTAEDVVSSIKNNGLWLNEKDYAYIKKVEEGLAKDGLSESNDYKFTLMAMKKVWGLQFKSSPKAQLRSEIRKKDEEDEKKKQEVEWAKRKARQDRLDAEQKIRNENSKQFLDKVIERIKKLILDYTNNKFSEWREINKLEQNIIDFGSKIKSDNELEFYWRGYIKDTPDFFDQSKSDIQIIASPYWGCSDYYYFSDKDENETWENHSKIVIEVNKIFGEWIQNENQIYGDTKVYLFENQLKDGNLNVKFRDKDNIERELDVKDWIDQIFETCYSENIDKKKDILKQYNDQFYAYRSMKDEASKNFAQFKSTGTTNEDFAKKIKNFVKKILDDASKEFAFWSGTSDGSDGAAYAGVIYSGQKEISAYLFNCDWKISSEENDKEYISHTTDSLDHKKYALDFIDESSAYIDKMVFEFIK